MKRTLTICGINQADGKQMNMSRRNFDGRHRMTIGMAAGPASLDFWPVGKEETITAHLGGSASTAS